LKTRLADTKTLSRLVSAATEARRRAYAPYSGVRIGAAVLTRSGKVYAGCNVENSSFGLSNCAERTAIFKAVSEGERAIVAIAVVAESEELTRPCGACRQVMMQFNPRMKVLMRGMDGTSGDATAESLLPVAFNPQGLSKR